MTTHPIAVGIAESHISRCPSWRLLYGTTGKVILSERACLYITIVWQQRQLFYGCCYSLKQWSRENVTDWEAITMAITLPFWSKLPVFGTSCILELSCKVYHNSDLLVKAGQSNTWIGPSFMPIARRRLDLLKLMQFTTGKALSTGLCSPACLTIHHLIDKSSASNLSPT